MATTGLAAFTMTRDDMIKASLRLLTELGVGEVPVPEDYTNCNQALNLVLKSWQKKGAVLWTYQELVLSMVPGVSSYPIGPTAGYLATAGITILTTGAGGTTGTYPLTITDSTGTSAAGTFTVSGGVLTGVTITTGGSSYSSTPNLTFPGAGFTTAPTVSVTTVGLTVNYPLRPIDAFLRNIAQQSDVPLILVSRKEYDMLGAKSSTGIPNQLHWYATIPNAQVVMYNPPSDQTREVHLIVQRQIFDMVNSTDNFDLPQEWLHAVKWGLADELSLEYGAEVAIMDRIRVKAEQLVEECFNFSQEEASVYFTMDNQMRQH